jgi:hypothetical protein
MAVRSSVHIHFIVFPLQRIFLPAVHPYEPIHNAAERPIKLPEQRDVEWFLAGYAGELVY